MQASQDDDDGGVGGVGVVGSWRLDWVWGEILVRSTTIEDRLANWLALATLDQGRKDGVMM